MSLEGVSRVNASFEKEQAEIVYDPEIVSIDEIREKITEAGYEVKESGSFPKAAAILIILAALYIIARHTGLLKFFDIYPSIETAVSMGMLFGIGFLTSVHCIAMCGGINLTQSMVSSEKQGNLLRSNLLYNTGRIISYTLTGAICGGIGRTIGISGTLRGIIPIIAGVFMLIMALRMLGLFRFLRGIKLPDSFRFYKKLRLRFGGNKNSSSFIIGLMNGLMPCGPLQSMQLYALSTGSVFRGAASMFLFSLGTVPLMFGFGFFSGKLNMKYRKTMLTVSAVLVTDSIVSVIPWSVTLSITSEERCSTKSLCSSVITVSAVSFQSASIWSVIRL